MEKTIRYLVHACWQPTTRLFTFGLLLVACALAQQPSQSPHNGVIHGLAIEQVGQPARLVGLTAYQVGAAVGGILPHVKTNNAGKYRFECLQWGRYSVYAEDEAAGYSSYSTGGAGDGPSAEVELTAEHTEAEVLVQLPTKAGFLQIHLTNRRTGAVVPAMRVALMSVENPVSPLFTMSTYSNHIVLLPPDKDLLLHVTSDGFLEWDGSIGTGKPIRLGSGAQLRLDVELEPASQ